MLPCLIISETILHESFSAMQFNIDRYNFFRSGENANGGDILVYMRNDAPCKLIPMRNSTIERFFIELNLRKKKQFLYCSCNPHRRFISNHLNDIGQKTRFITLVNKKNFLSSAGFRLR